MRNWFNTLNEALESENLVSFWPLGLNVSYNESVCIVEDGKSITVTRDNRGMYERPIHYLSACEPGIIFRMPMNPPSRIY